MCTNRRTFIGGLLSTACCGPVARADQTLSVDTNSFEILCGLGHQPVASPITKIRPAQPQAVRVIHWIADLIGVRPAFTLLEADFTREFIAVAATRGKKRFVIYDAKWFVFEPNAIGWYGVWILAHEIGHHLYGHTHGFKPDQHQGELNADRFGGWVVARLGGRLDQALALMPRLPEGGSRSHPPRNDRTAATEEGWRAGRIDIRRLRAR